MRWQIKIERAGAFVPYEVVDLPDALAAHAHCQSLQDAHGACFSASPADMGAIAGKVRGFHLRHTKALIFTLGVAIGAAITEIIKLIGG